jgi:small subunit ribosomal protein S7
MTANSENNEIKLFGKWSVGDIEIKDAGLKRYTTVGGIKLPHSGGRHEHKKFGKSNVALSERLVNNMMRHGLSGGKKAKAIKIVKDAFEIIKLKTGKNPVEVLVRAVENSAPCEDTTRISFGGIVYHMSVDVAPQRRIDLSLRFISEGARKTSFNNPKPIEECLADELIPASEGDNKSFAIQRRNEIERIALSSR